MKVARCRRAAALPLAAFLCLSLCVAAEPGGLRTSDVAWAAKLDPFLRRVAVGSERIEGVARARLEPGSAAVLRALPPFVMAQRAGDDPTLHVKARIESERSWRDLALVVTELGGELRGRVGPILSLRLPARSVADLARRPEVRWLAASRTYELHNEISTGPDHVASRAATPIFGTSGQGVIVAVVDTGIDWTNLDFRHPDGTTRLVGIWDQTLTDPGHPPPPGFSFGAYYSAADIDAALASAGSLMTGDVHGHGSHVTGTAAGSGRQTGNGVPPGTFAGVAPEADLLTVKVFEGPAADFCDACDLTAAVQFIRQTALAAGRPWVGNMSLGHSLGAHDGTDPDELAIDAAVGAGRPGAHMAISAGNTGSTGRHFHWEGLLVQGQTSSNTFSLPDGPVDAEPEMDFVWLDLWYAGSDRATVTLRTPDDTMVSASWGADSGIVCTPSGAVQVDATAAPHPANGDNQVFVQIWDSSACDPVIDPQPGDWRIEIGADAVDPGGGPFDLWNAADTRGRTWVNLQSFSLAKTIGMPGTSRHALTAGSYVSKDQWANAEDPPTTTGPCCGTPSPGSRSTFSSRGPTRDGRIKPDVAAPGEWVGSSISANDATPPGASFQERDGQHHNLRGTSMASPHVAGVTALLFGINPSLDGAHAGEAVRRAARIDLATGSVPNTLFGHGKLYALRAGLEAASVVTDLATTGAGGFTGAASPLVDGYRVYRGLLSDLRAGGYGVCFISDIPAPDFTDPQPPAAETGFFYLVTGVFTDPETSLAIEGMLGTDSAGNPRPNASPCP